MLKGSALLAAGLMRTEARGAPDVIGGGGDLDAADEPGEAGASKVVRIVVATKLRLARRGASSKCYSRLKHVALSPTPTLDCTGTQQGEDFELVLF